MFSSSIKYFNCYSKHVTILYTYCVCVCVHCTLYNNIFDLNVIHTTLHSVSENHHRNYGIHILKGFSRITCKLYVYMYVVPRTPLYILSIQIYIYITAIIHDQRVSIRTMCDMVPIHIHFDMLVEERQNFAHILLCYIQSLSTMKHGEMCLFGKLWFK